MAKRGDKAAEPEPGSKAALRRECWLNLRMARAARFPGVEGRIPNFVGSEAAAERLFETEIWKRARVVKCNPDSPQRAVRRRALLDGKKLYLAVPRLQEDHPFVELDRAWIDEKECWDASSIQGGSSRGRAVQVRRMKPIDLIVTGCVGASRDGSRLGKGGGFSDLEFALLREAGLVGGSTPVVTTLHPAQLVEPGGIPMLPHDQPLDLIALPDELVICDGEHPRPRGIRWTELDDDKLASIPVLARLARRRKRRARKA